MSYSVQLFSVRKPLEEDFAGTIARIAEIGFTDVEAYNFVATAEKLRAALSENGLTAESGHAPLLSGNQDEIFSAAQRLGIKTVIDPYLPAEQWQRLEDIKATAEKLNTAAVKAAGYGLRVGYHNHRWELATILDGTTALEHLAEYLSPEVVLEVDTYWAAVGGRDPVELLTHLGERVKLIHIKDGPITVEKTAQLPAGQGRMAVREVIQAAKFLEIGVVEFDDYDGDIFDGLAKSLAYLRSEMAQR